MKPALDIITTAPEFDLIVAVVGSSSRFHPELAVRPVVDSANAAKPIAAYMVPDAPEALAMLGAAGVPSFRTPEACADAIAAVLKRRAPQPIVGRVPVVAGEAWLVDELEAVALLDRLKIPRAPAIALDISSAILAPLPFPYPVAVKALSADIPHKTEVGGVVLNVKDAPALLAATAQIANSVAARNPGTPLERVLVQPMITGLGEVLIGYRIDPDVGPLVMVAAGGIFTEIYRDRSLRLAPIDLATAHEMIGEVAGLKLLGGYRGKPAGDLDALASAIVALSQLAVLDEPAVIEAEINPLIVRPAGEGVVAVDALVKYASKA
jgi:acyl-CoA synthetase (NDP forming)